MMWAYPLSARRQRCKKCYATKALRKSECLRRTKACKTLGLRDGRGISQLESLCCWHAVRGLWFKDWWAGRREQSQFRDEIDNKMCNKEASRGSCGVHDHVCSLRLLLRPDEKLVALSNWRSFIAVEVLFCDAGDVCCRCKEGVCFYIILRYAILSDGESQFYHEWACVVLWIYIIVTLHCVSYHFKLLIT